MSVIEKSSQCGFFVIFIRWFNWSAHVWKALAWHITSLRVEVWEHKSSLTPSLSIEVPVPSTESERSCICVLGVSISTMLVLDFGPVSTVWYLSVFHFIMWYNLLKFKIKFYHSIFSIQILYFNTLIAYLFWVH